MVTHAAVFAPYNRPYLIVSPEPHPDYPDQYVALGITTQALTDAIQIDADDWAVGRLTERSYVDPRYPLVLAERGIVDTVGALHAPLVDLAVDRCCGHLGA